MIEYPFGGDLAQACRRVGISVNTATKLMLQEFPEAFWLDGKLAEKIDRPPTA